MKRFIGAEIRALTNILKRELHQEGQGREACSTSINGLVIEYLMKNEDRDVFQRDFEEEFSMRRSTASRMLKSMESKGMINRESVACDARLRKITLTEQAKDSFEQVHTFHNQIEAKMTKDISNDDLNCFFKVIDKIKSNLEK